MNVRCGLSEFKRASARDELDSLKNLSYSEGLEPLGHWNFNPSPVAPGFSPTSSTQPHGVKRYWAEALDILRSL
jgi:hypothetical protein